MELGDVVAGRFTIERLAGRGGMGTVFRALDAATGGPVALKVLHATADAGATRFQREVALLADIQHPCVVAYVAHGVTPERQPFLAMEWLEGEDLEQRLSRAPLALEEAIVLGRRVASALAVLHLRGVVHRDVKPSNVMLVGRAIASAKLLDLGVARSLPQKTRVTRTGSAVGTPGYMAPEQARGEESVDARADVFALGCVLFECLTGRPAFKGEHPIAVLARILLEEPLRLSELVHVPPALDNPVARMLAKRPEDRPRDGSDVVAALERIGGTGAPSPTIPESVVVPTSVRRLPRSEQRKVTLVLASGVGTAKTLASEESTAPDERAVAEIRRVPGADLQGLADGSLLISFAGEGEATDRAARAANAALRLRRVLPTAPIAVATGTMVVRAAQPSFGTKELGAAIDHAATGLRALRPPAIAIDETTSDLLEGRFEVRGAGPVRELGPELAAAERARTLLGMATPTVGRERELAILRAILDESTSDSVARVALVTGAPGIGKTRVLQEFLKRLGEPRPKVIVASGDPVSAGSPLALAAQIVSRAAGLLDGEAPEVRRDKLAKRVEASAAGADRLLDFLGELVGAPSGVASDPLRTARKDPVVMGDQMRRAFEDLLAIETSTGPLLLVLEDLQWGDRSSVAWIDGALRTLRDRPLVVVALARPDVFDLFPKLWSERPITEVGLGELSKRPAQELVKHALPDAPQELVERIVAQSSGNAFYLEELTRVAARGSAELPPTIMAMIEARLEDLPAEARRALRAASVFGQVFHHGAVAQLFSGRDAPRSLVDEQLALLCARELIERRPVSRFPGEQEYAFRSALVREAAYGTLLDADRELAHKVAAKWLERAGERDALVLAEHFRKGGASDRALVCIRRAAEQALEGNDFEGVTARVDEARRAGASGDMFGEMLVLEAQARRWTGEASEQLRAAREAMTWTPVGAPAWFEAASEAASATARLGDHLKLPQLAALVRTAPRSPESASAFVAASARLGMLMMQSGAIDEAREMFTQAEAAASSAPNDPKVEGFLAGARAAVALAEANPARALRANEDEAKAWERAGDLRSLCLARVHVGDAQVELGAYEDAERSLRAALADAERMGLEVVAAIAKKNLATSMVRSGNLDEAEKLLGEAKHALADNKGQAASCRALAAEILLARGDAEAASAEAQIAAERLRGMPLALPALGLAAEAELSSGNFYNALAIARDAMELLERLEHGEEGESLVRLVYAEALHANGDREEAKEAIRAARASLEARSKAIEDERLRASFAAIPEHRRTETLAEAWLDPRA